MSKVIRDCIGFALLRSVIGLENSRHFLNQSDARLKPIATWSLALPRARCRLLVFASSSDWLFVIFPFVLIGRCDYFGFGFTTLNRKALYICIVNILIADSKRSRLLFHRRFRRDYCTLNILIKPSHFCLLSLSSY